MLQAPWFFLVASSQITTWVIFLSSIHLFYKLAATLHSLTVEVHKAVRKLARVSKDVKSNYKSKEELEILLHGNVSERMRGSRIRAQKSEGFIPLSVERSWSKFLQ